MHIGQLIKEKVEEQGKTIVWFSQQIPCNRTNVYKIFDKSSIDTRLLLRISTVLRYDFFGEYSKELEKRNI